MAPVTRSSVHGRQSTNVSTEASNDYTDEDFDMDEDQSSVNEGEEGYRQNSNSASPFRSAQDMLLPLQETANRVSRQVEDFAKALDKFKSERDVSDQDLWNEAVELLKSYATITDRRVKQTEVKARTGQGDVEEQLKALKLESNLWTLTENLLLCKCPETADFAKETLEQRTKQLHRYSTDCELWEHFLDGDVIAQEYETILDWLQEAAAEASLPLEEVIADLTTKSDRGDGIWSAGLIYTKDAIKKQKRSRAWPMPLDPSNPGLRNTHLRDDDDEPLVTQMDPDAPTREDAKLAVLDEYHEEAAWRICWEMLRRGMKIEQVRSWWSDRKETWRTALLFGTTNQKDQKLKSPWLRIMNLASEPEHMARNQTMSEGTNSQGYYEEAVYGILSGNHAATAKACGSLDDVLYSYFNAVLIERWKQFLINHRQVAQNYEDKHFQPPSSSLSALREFLEIAEAQDDGVRNEFHLPQKFIEAAVVSQDFANFFVQQGHSSAQVAHLAKQSPVLMEKDESEIHSDGAQIAAQDQDAVRIVAHLQLLLRRLGFLDKAYRQNEYQMDNNVVNYIGCLERDSKFYLLPLYASQLAAERIPQVLGTILIKVIDPRERETQVKLMKLYDIDVPTVLFGIYQLANYYELEEFQNLKTSKRATKVTEYVEAANNKLVKIRSAFMGDEPTDEEEKAILSVEWMRYIDSANWDMAILAVSTLHKMFLLTGKLTLAKCLLQRANLAELSLAATGMNLNISGQSDDMSEDSDADMDNSLESIEGRVQPVSPTRRRNKQDRSTHSLARKTSNREKLAAKSKVWAQLEQLVDALWALERWQDFADGIESIRGNITHMRTAKRELQTALNELVQSMTPLLERDFLLHPNDDTEAETLTLIRNHYIPEAILGYNSALYFAGHSLTRSYLVECMNLAQEVAQNSMLTDAFVQSGRMRELVVAFALDSQALLRANEAGGGSGSGKSKKGKGGGVGVEGKTDIWQVRWKEGMMDGVEK